MTDRIEWDAPGPTQHYYLAAMRAGDICRDATPDDLARAGYVRADKPTQASERKQPALRCDVPGCDDEATSHYCPAHEEISEELRACRAMLAAAQQQVKAMRAVVKAAQSLRRFLRCDDGPRSLVGLGNDHSHQVPSVWDPDNGDRAGTTCAQCVAVRRFVAEIDALPAAPSAVDPATFGNAPSDPAPTCGTCDCSGECEAEDRTREACTHWTPRKEPTP